MLHKKFRPGENILCGLVEHEAQRAHVTAMARPFAGIHELYVAVLEQSELQSLRGIVHLGRHNGIGHAQLISEFLIDIQERCPFGKALGDVVILTADL